MIQVSSFQCNEFQENTYVFYDDMSREAAIVDPGMKYDREWQRIKDFISDNKLTVKLILVTHYHLDHVIGSDVCTKEYGVGLTGSIEDQLLLPPIKAQGMIFGVNFDRITAPITNPVKEGDKISFGEHTIEIFDCPGHSYHGYCYYIPDAKILFSGDVLFYCSVGRADLGGHMGCSMETLITNVTNKLLNLPPEVTVYPGHGPQTSIDNELKYNPYL